MLKDDSKDVEASFTSNNPIVVIDEAMERMGYFSHFAAFSLACAFFEYFSYKNLGKKCVDIGGLAKKKGDDPTLYEFTKGLKENGIINHETYKKMNKVRKIRNKMIHPKGDISYLYKPTKDERLQIETAKECIEILLNYRVKKKKKPS